jgi:hypothetical protein
MKFILDHARGLKWAGGAAFGLGLVGMFISAAFLGCKLMPIAAPMVILGLMAMLAGGAAEVR